MSGTLYGKPRACVRERTESASCRPYASQRSNLGIPLPLTNMKREHLNRYASLFDIFETRVEQEAVSQLSQPVLGLRLLYPLRLRVNVQRATRARTCLPPKIASQLTSLEVLDARGVNPITDVAVYRYQFQQGTPLTLTEIAEGSAEHLRCLDGVRKTRCTIRTLAVSDVDARWISFSADRWHERLGVEELGIFDPATETFWTVQVTYKQRPPMHLMSAWGLYRARASARKILASICLAAQ